MQLQLGKDPQGAPRPFEANQLVTHGVILGMTGSGKTGLAMVLLEELAAAGTPLILIDPKGDLANLGLLYPEANAAQLEPWLDPAEVQRAGRPAAELAEEWGQKLQRGRLEWGIGSSRVAELRDKLELSIYTPGSRAGLPVNLLGCFECPGPAILEDGEARADLLSGLVQSLLALVGVSADPLRSPEAVVLTQIVDAAWAEGQSLKLEDLILRLADPPFKKVGVFPLESFYPSQQRLDLAMKLNALIASPAFAPWSEGPPLDVARLQQPRQPGKTPVSLFYLAHLSDAERMFFVSQLLQKLLSWTRGLSGTGSLRALVYFDEVAGYMPPHPYNPPSKQPLLTLLKQSRAVGLGLVLATQNPVDLDYKGLANAGTWWIGRMQTAQDREKVLDGLTLATAGLDRAALQAEFEQLAPRVFLCKSPDTAAPGRLQVRFAMSLLRGPVTRAELIRIQPAAAAGQRPEATPATPAPAPAESGRAQPPAIPGGFAQAFLDPRVVFSAQLEDRFTPFAEARREDGKTLWKPALWGELQLRFDEDKGGFVLDERHHYLFFPIDEGGLPGQWLRLPALESGDLLDRPEPQSLFSELPQAFDEAAELKAAQNAMIDDVFRRVTSSQWIHADLKLYGAGGEDEQAFRSRVEAALEDLVDGQVAKLQARVDKELSTLQERLSRHENRLDTLRNESQRRQTESLWSAGAAVLGFFTGKKRALSSALTSHNRSGSAKDRVNQAQGDLAELQARMEKLQTDLEAQVQQIREREAARLSQIEAREVRLERSDIRLTRFGVLWIPVTRRV